jgi:hypothetical protein
MDTSKEWHTTDGPNSCSSRYYQEEGRDELCVFDKGSAFRNGSGRADCGQGRMAFGNRKTSIIFLDVMCRPS